MEADTRPAWLQASNKSEANFWKIALAVAAGILLAGSIAFLARLWFMHRALEQINQSVNSLGRQAQEQIQREQQRQAQLRAAALEREARKRAEEADRERLRQLVEKQLLEQKLAKEAAWQRYYRKPELCDKAEGAAFVECANHHIRAKRKFEELWAAGKL